MSAEAEPVTLHNIIDVLSNIKELKEGRLKEGDYLQMCDLLKEAHSLMQEKAKQLTVPLGESLYFDNEDLEITIVEATLVPYAFNEKQFYPKSFKVKIAEIDENEECFEVVEDLSGFIRTVIKGFKPHKILYPFSTRFLCYDEWAKTSYREYQVWCDLEEHIRDNLDPHDMISHNAFGAHVGKVVDDYVRMILKQKQKVQ